MAKSIIVIILILSFASCKKDELQCYACIQKSTGLKVQDVCDIDQQKVAEYANKWKLICRRK